MKTAPIDGRTKDPRESPSGRIMVGWRGGVPVYADIYPSDALR